MKKFTILLTLIITFVSFSYNQNKFYNIYIKGKVYDLNNNKLKNVRINVYSKNELVKTFNSDDDGIFDFILDRGNVYTLSFNKYGYASKKIEISTEAVTEDELKYGLFPIKYDVVLYEYLPGIDYSILNTPVIKLFYSDYEGDFTYDKNYYKQMLEKLTVLENKIKIVKQEVYNSYIKNADELFNNKEYEEAIVQYQNAKFILPVEKYPDNQIDIIKSILKNQAKIEESYRRNIAKADLNYEKQNYKISRNYYQKSLIYKPNEIYPKKRINEIENLLAGNYNLLTKEEKDIAENIAIPNQVDTNNENNVVLNQSNNAFVDKTNNVSNTNINQTTPLSKIETQNIDNKPQQTFNPINNKSDVKKFNKDSSNYQVFQQITQTTLTSKSKEYLSKGLDAYKNNYFDKALNEFTKAFEESEKSGNSQEQAIIAETIADIMQYTYKYSAASDWYFKASSLYKNINAEQKSFETLKKAAETSYINGDLDQALSRYYYLVSTFNNKPNINLSSIYNSIGAIHSELENYTEAERYFDLSIKTAESQNDIKNKAITLNNKGNLQFDLKEYLKAIDYYTQSIELKKLINYKEGIAVSLYNAGNTYYQLANFSQAINCYNKSIEYSKQSGNRNLVFENYKALAKVYDKQKDCSKSLYYINQISEGGYTVELDKNNKQINETEAYYLYSLETSADVNSLLKEIRKQRLIAYLDALNKEKEIKYLNAINKLRNEQIKAKENKIYWQRITLAGTLAGVSLLLVSLIFLYMEYKKRKKANEILEIQNKAILEQKTEIENQKNLLFEQKNKIEKAHSELKDSIQYASRIQSAISINNLIDSSLLGIEYFTICKPLNIVSGDFIWIYVVDNEHVIFIIADCTGHGVPGAFMSILGTTLLNEIVKKENITEPDKIANRLREEMKKSLGKSINSSELLTLRDGMDIAIIKLNKNTLLLNYCGANIPIYVTTKTYYNNDVELIELKPDKMPIGMYENMNPFTLKSLQLSKESYIYLMSDGIISQFGGEKGKKLNKSKLKEILINAYNYSLDKQKHFILEELTNWQGNYPQVDDITVLGIKV